MSNKTRNEPAFPTNVAVGPSGDIYPGQFNGMMLRDYFAGQALAGFRGGSPSDETCKIMAKWAYRIADMMLAERHRD